MAGTKKGGQKAAKTNYYRHGADFYARIGRLGGQRGHTGGFAANPELAREAGRKGGLSSKRSFSYNYNFIQVKPFDIDYCDHRDGWQLHNISMGYRIKPSYKSCLEDAHAQKLAHTLHPIRNLPKNVDAPIYIDNGTPHGYMLVSIKGKLYDPQKKYKTLKGLKVLGWGEYVNNVQVIKLERITK